MFDPVFGPIGRSPLEKESVLGIDVRFGTTTRLFRCPAETVPCTAIFLTNTWLYIWCRLQ